MATSSTKHNQGQSIPLCSHQYLKHWMPDPGSDLEAEGQLPRLRAIISKKDKWANGSKLTYTFLDSDPRREFLVEKAVEVWSSIVGLQIIKVARSDDATVRISFRSGSRDGGHWSYVGTYTLNIPPSLPTMNLDRTADLDTAIHEWGHALGLKHEHQHPDGPVWDEDAVIRELSQPPNSWSVDQIRHNVLSKHTWADVQGDIYDSNSIMHYEFSSSWLNETWRAKFPQGIRPQPGISESDRTIVQSWYPPIPGHLALNLGTNNISIGEAGDTAVCAFTANSDGEYNFRTSGTADTLLVIEVGDVKRVDDDSGFARNASITMRLSAGQNASILARLYWAHQIADFKIVVTKLTVPYSSI